MIAEKVHEAREAIRVDWSSERADAVSKSMHRRRRTRALVRRASLTVIVAATLIGLGWAGGRFSGEKAARVAAPISTTTPPSDGALHFADGTIVTPIGGALHVREVGRDESATFAALDDGGAHFDVASKRSVRVRVGEITLEGAGAIDVVKSADGAIVTARRGRVIVAWSFGMLTLEEGETRAVPPASDTPSVASTMIPAASAIAVLHAGSKWRALASSGDYAAAYDDLHAAGPANVRDVPEELLLAADVARLSGHAADATDPLQRVVTEHHADPRAPLAAFTLGRVDLDQLGRPREAAAAFAQARALDPKGPLAEDALAREVESWARAGDTSLARERADTYLAQYPSGRSLRTVRAFGGVK